MTTDKVTAENRDAQGRFNTGNNVSTGRPRGAVNKSTRLAQEALQAHSSEIMAKLIEDALGGNETALRLCVERLVPVAKERPLPPVELGDDPKAAIRELLKDGVLTPSELAILNKIPTIVNFDEEPFKVF